MVARSGAAMSRAVLAPPAGVSVEEPYPPPPIVGPLLVVVFDVLEYPVVAILQKTAESSWLTGSCIHQVLPLGEFELTSRGGAFS